MGLLIVYYPAAGLAGRVVGVSGAGRGQRQRESSPRLGRRQGPRCPPAHSGLPGNWGPPPSLAQRRRRPLPAVPRAPSGENASSAARKPGREREGGSGRARGRPRGCRGLRPTCRKGPRTKPTTTAILPVSSTGGLMTTQKRRKPGLAQPMVGRDDLRARLRPEKPIESDGEGTRLPQRANSKAQSKRVPPLRLKALPYRPLRL